MIRRWAALLGAVTVAVVPASAQALELEPIIDAGRFSDPSYVTSYPTDPDRLLVTELRGRIRSVEDGVQSDFLDLTSLVAGPDREGLLSLALAPDFASTGRFYVVYTRAGTPSDPDAEGDVQIDEFTAIGERASLSSRRPVLTIEHSEFTNHNGGQLSFGPDGYLYISIGDGGAGPGSGPDPHRNGQNLDSLLGKLLRIDPRPSGASPYSVPADNPFAGPIPGADEIWSYGLRNPYRFSFDRLTGDLALTDVGELTWEEVNLVAAADRGRGANFGWRCREGAHPFAPSDAGCESQAFTDPAFEYSHADGRCSITGGYVVRDASLGDLFGRYLYADFCVGELRSVNLAQPGASGDRSEGISVDSPNSFGEDSCGRLYVTSLGDDMVYRLIEGGAANDCSDPPAAGEATALTPVSTVSTPPSCAGRVATQVAAEGERTVGTEAADVIVGTTGNDQIRGRGGADRICARAGDDLIRGGGGPDRIRAGAGEDSCSGGFGADRTRSCDAR